MPRFLVVSCRVCFWSYACPSDVVLFAFLVLLRFVCPMIVGLLRCNVAFYLMGGYFPLLPSLPVTLFLVDSIFRCSPILFLSFSFAALWVCFGDFPFSFPFLFPFPFPSFMWDFMSFLCAYSNFRLFWFQGLPVWSFGALGFCRCFWRFISADLGAWSFPCGISLICAGSAGEGFGYACSFC